MKPLRHISPYTQQYRFETTKEYAGKSVINFYVQRFGFKPREYWMEMIERGDILLNRQGVDADQILKLGDVLHTIRRDVEEPPVNDEICIIHEGDGVLVLNKQAPIPIHPSGRYFKNSLIHILREKIPDTVFHTIHRLDTWTTGVLVMATEATVARHLHLQVEKRQMKKIYGVLAVGDFGDKEFSVNIPVGRVDGAHRGTGPNITEAREALTIFTPLARKNNVTFLRAELITGRTNQIRVHVQAAGGAVLGDPLYTRPAGQGGVDHSPDFMGLHCRSMELSPAPGKEPQKFVADWPLCYLEYFSKEELDLC